MRKIWMVCLVVFCYITIPVVAADDSTGISPKTKDGKKWRVGYYEAGGFASYSATFSNITQALTKIGWLSGMENCPYQSDSRTLWTWLSTHNTGPYIEFVGDGFYTFDNEESRHNQTKEDLLQRLNQKKDIDLMLVMGTTAGKDMAHEQLSVPTMVFSTSDAVKAGIIDSIEDSGKSNLWAHIDPYRYKRQVELFQDIFHFKRLGVVYENSMVGRSYVALDEIEALAKERGFEIVSCYVDESISNRELYHANLTEAYRTLAQQVDAVYLSAHPQQELERLCGVLAPLTEKQIPTFTQFAREVQYGALMAVGMSSYEYVSGFDAENIAKVLNGATPRDLPQAFVSPPNIVINLEAADHIGYAPPFPILLTADTVYSKIEGQTAGINK